MIQDILDLVKNNSGIELRRFNKVDRCVLTCWMVKEDKLYIKVYQNSKYYRYKCVDKSSCSLFRK